MTYIAESMKNCLVMTFLLVSSSILCGESKPYHIDTPEMDDIDKCLFTCDFCFRFPDPMLVRCANDCIAMEGLMGPIWTQTCPYFGQKAIFPTHKVHK